MPDSPTCDTCLHKKVCRIRHDTMAAVRLHKDLLESELRQPLEPSIYRRISAMLGAACSLCRGEASYATRV